MLYFAYGSNLHYDEMRKTCPSAQKLSVSKLKNHRLEFTRKSTKRGCGVADEMPFPGQDVYGVVYEINDAELPALDEREGFHPEEESRSAYLRKDELVYCDSNPQKVSIYLVAKKECPRPLPSAEYKALIISGARSWGLPEEYISELEKIPVVP